MVLYLNQSTPRRYFKNLLGNANHLIITALVGLDAIERGIVSRIPDELRAAWSPVDANISARRSRRLVLDMALARSVDAFDAYMRRCRRKPSLIQQEDVHVALDKAGISVFKKFTALESFYELDPALRSLVSLMITWRNRAIHSEDDTETPTRHREFLQEYSNDISRRFRGLDTETLLAGYDVNRTPHFKEIASFINATNHFVEDLEHALFSKIDPELYLKEMVWVAISERKDPSEKITDVRRRRAQSIWGKDASERGRTVDHFLKRQGLSSTQAIRDDKLLPALVFERDLIDSLVARSPKEVLLWAQTRVNTTSDEDTAE